VLSLVVATGDEGPPSHADRPKLDGPTDVSTTRMVPMDVGALVCSTGSWLRIPAL